MKKLSENNKTIEQLEEIIKDLKKEKQESAEVYLTENFKVLLDKTTIILGVGSLGEILSMMIPYDSDLAQKLDVACGKERYTGIIFPYNDYKIWLNQEGQTWRLRVGPFYPEKYETRLEFIRKYVSNYDASLVDGYIADTKANIKNKQKKIDACEKALVDLVKTSVKRATK